jgi:hypothetical protein
MNIVVLKKGMNAQAAGAPSLINAIPKDQSLATKGIRPERKHVRLSASCGELTRHGSV